MWTMEYANINEFFYEPFPQAITINKFFLKKDKKKIIYFSYVEIGMDS
jgi:hypothetical protein